MVQNRIMQITYDKNSLIVDGKRVFIRSGAFHYFRTPGVEAAKDRFMKMKAAGYNAVDIYFNWNYHSKNEGQYDFSGIKDVSKILQTAKEVGLFVIARPGPFINAEVNAGGLPFWLLTKKDVIPRNRIGSQYQYSPEYMKFISQWYDNIIPIITEFDNIIAFQIENEYATDEMDEEYMKELYQMARNRGISCPIFHNDAYNAGLWADVVDIYACDVYPYINPNQNWKQDHFCFDTLDNLEDMVRSVKNDAPIFIAEMQGGWFDKWDGIGYKQMRAALSDEHINIVTKTAISQGVTMFNHYMAVGGTSWDDLACDEVYTSYEFTSGIDEFGILQPNFFKAKEINYLLNYFQFTNTDERENLQLGNDVYSVKRKDFENNYEWIFVRNMNPSEISLQTKDFCSVEREISIQPYDMKILPIGLQLNACKIEFSDAEIFAGIKNEKNEIIFIKSDKKAIINLDVDGEKISISADKKDYENVKFEKDGKSTEFLFLTKELSDRTWILDDKVIFNADFVYSNGRIGLEKTTEVAYFDFDNGFSKKYFKFQEPKLLLNLEDLKCDFCAHEIDNHYEYENWGIKANSLEKFDSLSIGTYDEFVWYKAKIPNFLEEITLSARHLFAVYINGKELLNRNSYKYEKLQQIEETISIRLDKNILDKVENELTILVQNLGFDKGFSGETNHPRGLVQFDTVPQIGVDFYVREKLSCEVLNTVQESESPYLARLSAEFDIEFKENVVRCMYLSMQDFPYERATIFLNGVKIGRYLKNNKNEVLQDKFYLINEFLKEHNTLEIVVWEKSQNIKTPWDFKFELKHVIIQVGDEKIYQLY